MTVCDSVIVCVCVIVCECVCVCASVCLCVCASVCLCQDLIHPDAKDRQFLHFFYKRAAKKHFKVHQYNLLRKELAMV